MMKYAKQHSWQFDEHDFDGLWLGCTWQFKTASTASSPDINLTVIITSIVIIMLINVRKFSQLIERIEELEHWIVSI